MGASSAMGTASRGLPVSIPGALTRWPGPATKAGRIALPSRGSWPDANVVLVWRVGPRGSSIVSRGPNEIYPNQLSRGSHPAPTPGLQGPSAAHFHRARRATRLTLSPSDSVRPGPATVSCPRSLRVPLQGRPRKNQCSAAHARGCNLYRRVSMVEDNIFIKTPRHSIAAFVAYQPASCCWR